MRKYYPWTLVGPWYRMESVGGGPGRSERPIIQKYASPDFVNQFLKEPQHSLMFVCEDFINRICLNHIYEPVTPGNRQNGEQLKLFLDTHSRFYMVICELHCMAPGRPSVSRDQVCEAGFVVRRYTSTITDLSLQKWVPSKNHKGVGSWDMIGDTADMTPQTITEEIYPLYPLIPDPADKDHSAFGKTMWFGVVPTYSGDVDENGYSKFDNESAYEIRCFVRRHKEICPKKSTRDDCHGEIVWSEATETYKLAAYFDLDGTGHRPVNIQLPDLNALKEQAIRGPVGKGVNVRMNAPADSALNFVSNGMDMPDKGSASLGSQICFFCIPLITLVALFVFRLFLPILVWLFGLWFLLRLKFCIPPSVSFNAQLAADLKAFGPDFEAQIDFELKAHASITLDGTDYNGNEFSDIKDSLINNLVADLPAFMQGAFVEQLESDFDSTVDLIVDVATDFSDEPDIEELAGQIPLPEDGLIYFEKVPLL